MSHFVQTRFQTSSSSTSSIDHDFRLVKVSYLREDMWHNKFENQYFVYKPEVVKQEAKNSFNEYNKLYSDAHFEKYKKRRDLKVGRQSDFLTGIVTLSNSINEKLENAIVTKEELDKLFFDSVLEVKKEVENEIGEEIKLFHVVVHYDEKTPHCHFAFSNHTKKGEAAFYKLRMSKNKPLSKCQDSVGKVFEKIAFLRGKKKELTGARHKSVREMHDAERLELVEKNELLRLKLIEKEQELANKEIEIQKISDDLLKLKKNLSQEIKHEQTEIKVLQEKKETLKTENKALQVSNSEIKKELDVIDLEIHEKREAVRNFKGVEQILRKVKDLFSGANENDYLKELVQEINTVLNIVDEKVHKVSIGNLVKKIDENLKIKNQEKIDKKVVLPELSQEMRDRIKKAEAIQERLKNGK